MITIFNQVCPLWHTFCLYTSELKTCVFSKKEWPWHSICLYKNEERSGRLSKIILASHGELSKGLLNSVSMIVGDLAKDVETFSLYPGQSPNDILNQIEADVRNNEEEQYLILCDIKGGSVHTTLSKLIVYPNVVVISGMNMNMVLDLILSHQNGLTESAFEGLIQNAKEGITLLSKTIAECDDEDF